MPAPFPPLPQAVYAARRDEVRRRMRELAGPSTLVVHSTPVATRNHDVEHPYRADADLYWLTGFTEPECALVLSTEGNEPFTLFVRPRDKDKELWNGRRHGLEGARVISGAHQSFGVALIDAELPKLIQQPTLFYRLGGTDPHFDARIARTLTQLRMRGRTGITAPRRLEDPGVLLHELRLLKDSHELSALRRAIELTRAGHLTAMEVGRGGTHEHELEAALLASYRSGGAVCGYSPIVAAGRNATILHYNENDAPVRDGELVLIDSGAEVALYTADVTRTFPASGTFTPAQAKLYDLVLRAADLAIEHTAPGVTIDGLHDEIVHTLTEGMIELGLLEGTPEARIADSSYRRFYMHRSSHWLGLDVHDAGAYRNEANEPRALVPGMVFTIEPGLYIAEDDVTAPPELRGTGVRIEDDILVTESGHENLTASIPRTRADVEQACAR
ncbi:MAG: aminopeptidase P N-terminal domain-containing protein [Deltaproteobacteria bacterium]|nr:aminopeptidase P N-terminal domain-containing protein [Deltaproteobacteria bacterium]